MSSFSLSYRGKSAKREFLFSPSPALDHKSSAASPVLHSSSNPQQLKGKMLNTIAKFQRNRHSTLPAICILWLLLIWYGERSYPYRAIKSCKWHKGYESPSRVALIADPQIIDDNTYPGRPRWLLSISQYIVDYYLRRNWVYINQALDPDANIFLGDLFDGGREWGDQTWIEEFKRYNRIFTKPPYKKTVMSLPGNHDIGYGNDIVPHALGRFQAYFGAGSSTVDVGNHTFVLLDSISMLNQVNESIYGPPREFVERLDSPQQHNHPRILLTHVPLYRPPDHKCGSKREHGNEGLPYIRGKQYQTLVDPQASNMILEKIRPVGVFSGDDHDACHVHHRYNYQNVERDVNEFTVKSISMAMGIQHPGIQLVTLNSNPQDVYSQNFETSICLMPSPFYAFILYGIMSIVSVGAFIQHYRRHYGSREVSYLPLHGLDTVTKKRPASAWYLSIVFWRNILVTSALALAFYFYLGWTIYDE